MNKFRKFGIAAAVLATIMTGLFWLSFFDERAAWPIVIGLQLVLLWILLDSRKVLSARIFAVGKKLERRLRSQPAESVAPRVQPKGTSVGAAPATKAVVHQTPAPAIEDQLAIPVRRILAARVFDVEWYETQVDGRFRSPDAAVRHYLERGRRSGFSPHPLFVPAWYEPKTWKTSAEDPLLQHLRNEANGWSRPTSPVFDPRQLPDDMPESSYGPLASFLLNAGPDAVLPYDAETTGFRPGLNLAVVRDVLISESIEWRARENAVSPTRGSGQKPSNDEALQAAVAEFEASGERPLVSIILPTWNRASVLGGAITSVKAQSYENWELIVADDGSVDDTALVLAAEVERDSRIKVVSLKHAGVSAARNAALRVATGEFVAFLDSDKEWDREFLNTMLGYLTTTRKEAAASACEVWKAGRPFYRSVQAASESLLEVGNSIDQVTLVLRRDLALRTGGFDENLPRAVDYDFILSVHALAEIDQLSYVGVRYTEDAQDPFRISESETVAWNFFVRDRRHWREGQRAVETTKGLLSVIVDDVHSFHEAREAISNIRECRGTQDVEILLIAHNNYWPSFSTLALSQLADMAVRVVPIHVDTSRPLHINQALRVARGEFIYVTSSVQRVVDGSLSEWVSTLVTEDAAVAHPIVLGANRLVRDAGVVYPDNGRDPVPFLKGMHPDAPGWQDRALEVPGAPLPLLMRRLDAVAVRGMETRLRRLWADIDFSQRVALHRSKPVVTLTRAKVLAHGETAFARNPQSSADVFTFASLWPVAPRGSRQAAGAAGVSADFYGVTALSRPDQSSTWTSARWRPLSGSSVEVRERAPRLRWAIKTAAPADERAQSWGDMHFAGSLASALRQLGQDAVVDFQPNAERESSIWDDVVVNLRGLRAPAIPSNTTSVTWVISHPDEVTPKELVAYDLRYAASVSWAETVGQQWGINVTPLLQCTDPDRFYVDSESVDEVREKAVMVGNSRKQFRPAAWHTARLNYPLAVYGNDWSDILSEEVIAGRYVPNDELRRYYRSARWALNDHWPDMRDRGFISNRIFDILASGGRLLTDDVTNLDRVIGDSSLLPNGLAVFSSPVELQAILENGPDAYYSDEALSKLSAMVRSEHTFYARATKMLDDVLRFRSTDPDVA